MGIYDQCSHVCVCVCNSEEKSGYHVVPAVHFLLFFKEERQSCLSSGGWWSERTDGEEKEKGKKKREMYDKKMDVKNTERTL